MTMTMTCNGCGIVIDEPAVTAERTNGFSGGRPLPDQGNTVHWCTNCGLIAFGAVAAVFKGLEPSAKPRAAYYAARDINGAIAQAVKS